MIRRYHILKEKFYAGPDWIRMPSFFSHASYRSPTLLIILWIYAFIYRSVAVPGRIIIPISFLIFSYSLIIMHNPIRIMAFGLISVVISDLLIGFVFRPRKIRIERIVPERVTKGIPFQVYYEIFNDSNLPVWNLIVDPMPFFGFNSKESEPEIIPTIAPHSKVVFISKRTASMRGEFEIYKPIIESIFPFSIFKWSKRSGQPAKIIVHPDFPEISSLSLPGAGNYQMEGETQSAKTGESSDFIGCREFRTGDNPKYIHWPSTARRGELIVREFQEEYLARISIICDKFLPPAEPLSDLIHKTSRKNAKTFEALVALNCSIIDFISHSNYMLEIFIAGNEVYHIQGGRSKRKFDYLMDIISCMKPEKIQPLNELPEKILESISSAGTVILIVVKWDESRKKLFKQLSERGIFIKTILISEDNQKLPAEIISCKPDTILSKGIKIL